MKANVLSEIDRSTDRSELFNLIAEYYGGQGFGAVCYVAPSDVPGGAEELLERGMPPDWMGRYHALGLERYDPIPGKSLQGGRTMTLGEVVETCTTLSSEERTFIAAFKGTGMAAGLAIPTYGPYGRPGFWGLTMIADPALLKDVDRALAAAVAQHAHLKMEQLRKPEFTIPHLSAREREIMKWVEQGKSNTEIAAILGIAVPTVSTHLSRVYHKLQVYDRTAAVAKAIKHSLLIR